VAYEGWLSFAGTEIINNDRCRAYASALAPNLQMTVSGDEDNDTLRKMIDDEPYRTPMLDDAPWVDPDDPDTYDFCGVMGLSVVGLSDSTRAATITENTGDGGGVGGKRKGTRSIRYSALLVGGTQAAVEAGQAWLSSVLEGDCDADCNGSDACYLQALTDPQDWGDLVTDPVPISSLTTNGAKGTYDHGTGLWSPKTSTEELRAPAITRPLPCDEVVWNWTFTGVPGTRINLRSYSENGKVFEDWLTIDSDGSASRSISDLNDGKTTSYCGIRLQIGSSVTVNKVTVTTRDSALNTACFDHYMRQVREASCIDGPTATSEYNPSCGALRQVEFTIASNKPWQFGVVKVVASQSNLHSTMSTDQSLGVWRLKKTISAEKYPTPPSLVIDPACPKVPTPPRASATFTDCKPSVNWYASYGISIPGAMIPLWHDAVPQLFLSTGEKAARGVRVRFYPRPLGTLQDAEDIDPQSSCGEFVIDYIPAHATFTLDGLNHTAWIKLPGKAVLNPANHLLSGLTASSLFEWPVLTCGTDYMAIIDVDGENHSVTKVELRLATRWG
jgi:hypothetical protein